MGILDFKQKNIFKFEEMHQSPTLDTYLLNSKNAAYKKN